MTSNGRAGSWAWPVWAAESRRDSRRVARALDQCLDYGQEDCREPGQRGVRCDENRPTPFQGPPAGPNPGTAGAEDGAGDSSYGRFRYR